LGHGFSPVDTHEQASYFLSVCLASIGPRIFTRGYLRMIAYCGTALLSLQLGHGFSPVDTSAALAASGTAVPVLQLGHGFSPVDTGFCWQGLPASGAASIGPRIFTRGYFICRLRTETTSSGFNWATDFHPWIPWYPISRCSSGTMLQLGHGFSPVDTAPFK
jgi:hypothetical protein